MDHARTDLDHDLDLYDLDDKEDQTQTAAPRALVALEPAELLRALNVSAWHSLAGRYRPAAIRRTVAYWLLGIADGQNWQAGSLVHFLKAASVKVWPGADELARAADLLDARLAAPLGAVDDGPDQAQDLPAALPNLVKVQPAAVALPPAAAGLPAGVGDVWAEVLDDLRVSLPTMFDPYLASAQVVAVDGGIWAVAVADDSAVGWLTKQAATRVKRAIGASLQGRPDLRQAVGLVDVCFMSPAAVGHPLGAGVDHV